MQAGLTLPCYSTASFNDFRLHNKIPLRTLSIKSIDFHASIKIEAHLLFLILLLGTPPCKQVNFPDNLCLQNQAEINKCHFHWDNKTPAPVKPKILNPVCQEQYSRRTSADASLERTEQERTTGEIRHCKLIDTKMYPVHLPVVSLLRNRSY